MKSDSLPSRKHDVCRISTEIFLLREVFNTGVDKFVEKYASSQANYTLLSILNRFALFRCKDFLLAFILELTMLPRSKNFQRAIYPLCFAARASSARFITL
jgi:hypothetical protein